MNSTQPIGIFDSGIGGLTVTKVIKEILPNESIIYFGDTAHLPYGGKSTAAIQAYSARIADYLLNQSCKVILIACNSASAAAYDLVRKLIGKKAMVFDVINPTIDYISENSCNQKIGLIGTQQTINSGVYAEKISALNRNIDFVALATPLLVPMIEEGIYEDRISRDIIKRYLSDQSLETINALILGCTHYPIIKKQIGAYFSEVGREVEIIDSAETTAKALRSHLEYHHLLAKRKSRVDEFKVSDHTSSFERITNIFFGEEVHLAQVPIWETLR
ncbi:MAG: glutamate racemase [Ekhidna sp.]|nr:glutamate racemase [Ekhidna sp.]